MNPKSGRAGAAVAPVAPKNPLEAGSTDPGEAGPAEKPYKPPKSDEERAQKTGWIEIELVDEADQPVPGECVKIKLPDGSVYEGTLNEKGLCRIEGIDPGMCEVTFPNLDKDAWEKA